MGYKEMTPSAFQRMAEHVWIRIIVSIMLGLLLSVLVFAFVLSVESGYLTGFAKDGLAGFVSIRFFGLLVAFSLFSYFLLFRFSPLVNFLFKYRWLLACIFLALCVIFQISGSSLGMMLQYFGVEDDTLAGIARSVRSDEWAVNTPMAISQAMSDTPYSYFDDNFRGNETDMFIVYGQPSWDVASVFRPFHWGYLVLGPEYGLSFFWCGRLIFLFMVSLEFGMRVLVGNSRPLAVGYAFFTAFSGLVQWWFAVNGLVEMMIFGQLAIIWGMGYLRTSSYAKRSFYAVGIAWCLGVYILTFYPAWQVAFGYVFLALLVNMLISELPGARKSWKDIVVVIGALALLVIAMIYIFSKSWDTVDAVMNTAYPGKRVAPGGGAGMLFFYYPLELFASISPHEGVCEYATFFTGFPLCLLLPVYLMVRQRRASSLMVSLLIVSLFLFLYSAIGFPEILSKLTLLSYSTGTRASAGCGFAMQMLLFASLSRVDRSCARGIMALSFVSAVIEIAAFTGFAMELQMKFYVLMGMGVAVFFAFTAMIWMKWGKRAFCGVCVCFSMLTGMLVNPVVTNAVSKFQDNETVDVLRDQYEEGDLWATVDLGYLHSNAIAAQGIRVLDSTNVYPQIDIWRKLDPDGSYDDIYNRYAHIRISLKDSGAPEFELASNNMADSIIVKCTSEDLASLGVDVIVSPNPDLEVFARENASIEKTSELPNGFSVYELTSTE